MALVLADRVLETTAVAGTGNAALAGAQANYQPFSVIGDGSTTYYTIVDNTNNEWEVGIGTYVATGNYISRDTVLSSSNGGALVYFPSGTKDIFLDLPSEVVTNGDVVGPASAVNNNFAAFNLTTGKLIKDSGYNATSFATAAQGAKADTAVQPGSLGSAAYLTAGAANGVATLDAGGKVPTSQIPQMGDLNYQGTWDASTNTPTLVSSSGTKGYYYVVSVAGSTNLNGITDWKVGDWAVFNGSVWEKIDNTDAVTSVNGYTGTVVLTASDVGAAPATSGTSILYGNGSGGTSNVTIGSGVAFVGGTLSATGSGGDVVGPASSTDNAIARFDTTTGKLLQNSAVTIDDSGNISGASSISTIDYAQLDTTAAASIALGKLRWNVDTATAAFGIIDGTTEVNIGQQMYAYVTNAESVTITAGQAVYLYQATGNRASVKLAYNTGDATSSKTLGLVTADIAAGATGFVTTQGVLGKLNTGSFAEGDTLYLGATAGSLTATKPSAPNHLVYIGVVERANNGNGQIYVRPQNGYELNEIHDVQIISPANGQTILYDASTSLWKNANLTAGTGISISNGAASVTVNNTGVTSVGGTGTVNGLTLTGTVTTTGNITLGGTLSNIANSALTNSSITINGVTIALGGSSSSVTAVWGP